MQLIVKTLSGSEVHLTFDPTDTVMSIKQSLQEKEGIEIAMIKLIFKGKQLNDEQTIKDCKLEAGECIHMVLMLR